MTDPSQLSDAQLQAQIDQLQAASNTASPQPSSPISVQPLPPVQGVNSAGQPLANTTGHGAFQYNPAPDPAHLTDAQLEQQLQALLADSNPHMSPGEDVARATMAGLQRAAAGIPTAARGLDDLSHAGLQAAADFASRHTGGPHLEMPRVSDMLHAPGTLGAGQFAQGVIGKAAQVAGLDPVAAQAMVGAVSPTLALAGPSPGAAAQALNGGLPLHVPQTAAGRYADRIATFAPLALAPASIPERLAAMITPGVVSQGAEDIAPQNLKTAAALLGAVVGGGMNAGVTRAVRAPQASFGGAMEGVTADQMAQAQALRQSAAARGLSITVPEAVQQVTNNGTGLGRLQRVVESTKQGQALTAPYFAQRPDQIAQAVRGYADTIAPATDAPGMVGANAQKSAQGVLDQVRGSINDIAEPHYTALSGESFGPVFGQAAKSAVSYQKALAQIRGNRELNAGIATLPDDNLAVVNEVVKQLDRNRLATEQTALNPRGNNQIAGLQSAARGRADTLAGLVSDNWRQARNIVQQGRAQFLDPLDAGPVGAIARSGDVGAQTSALYPGIPVEGAPAETAQAVRALGVGSPGTAEDLTRQHIVNALNESLSELQGGQNQYAGAKLAVRLAANPEQAATLRSGVGALPGGEARASDLDGLLQALQATGKRQPPGSMTAFNEADLKDLHIAPFAQAIGRIADPLEWGKGIADVLNRANYRRNTSQLAAMIMADPEETAAVLARARAASRGGAHPLLPALLSHGDSR